MKSPARWVMRYFYVPIPSFVARPSDRLMLFVKQSCYSSNKLSTWNNILHYLCRSISGWRVSVNIYSEKEGFIKQELDFLEDTGNSATPRRSWRNPKMFYCNLFLAGIKVWSDWLEQHKNLQEQFSELWRYKLVPSDVSIAQLQHQQF